MTKDYAVVYFHETKDFSEIPSNWLHNIDKMRGNLTCKWPPSNIKNTYHLIKNRCDPGKNWIIYDIDIIRYCDTMEKARRAAEDATYTSSEENSLLGRRHRPKRHTNKRPRSDSSTSEDANLNKKQPAASMSTMHDDLSFDQTKVNQQPMNDDDNPISSGDDNSLNSTIKESTNSKKPTKGLSKTNDKDFQTQRKTLQTNKDSDSCDDDNVCFQILRNILNNTEEILTVLGKVVIDIQDLKQRYTVFENSDECTSAKSLILGKIKDFLPLENKEAVTEFELYLSKSVENRKGFQQIIRQVGGTNGEDYSRRVFALLFSPSFAKNNTWEGKKTKYSIKNLHVIAIVEELILQKFPTWTSADFGKTGINWFRLGNQRSGKQPGQLQKKTNVEALPDADKTH